MQKANNVTGPQVAPHDYFLDNGSMSESEPDDEAVEDGMLFDAQPPLTPTPSTPTPLTSAPTPGTALATAAGAGAGQVVASGAVPDSTLGTNEATAMDVDAMLDECSQPAADVVICVGLEAAAEASAGLAAEVVTIPQVWSHIQT